MFLCPGANIFVVVVAAVTAVVAAVVVVLLIGFIPAPIGGRRATRRKLILKECLGFLKTGFWGHSWQIGWRVATVGILKDWWAGKTEGKGGGGGARVELTRDWSNPEAYSQEGRLIP